MTVAKNHTNYGPLQHLIGKWVGEIGVDIAPDKSCEPAERKYVDTLTFTGVGNVTNAGEQHLLALKYHHEVKDLKTAEVFHDQIGHWLFEPETGILMHSLSLPRGVCLLAGGQVEEKGNEIIFDVEANCDDNTFGIIQSPFMAEKAKTESFKMRLKVSGDQMTYQQNTQLFIYGKAFDHVDTSNLTRVSS